MGKRRRRAFKKCSCGATYTLEEWCALERVGFLDTERELQKLDGEHYVPPTPKEVVPPFEMRDCAACGSTISVVVPYSRT